jgi:hypothetical protein
MLSKCVMRRMWGSQTPLRQFKGVPYEILTKVGRWLAGWAAGSLRLLLAGWMCSCRVWAGQMLRSSFAGYQPPVNRSPHTLDLPHCPPTHLPACPPPRPPAPRRLSARTWRGTAGTT